MLLKLENPKTLWRWTMVTLLAFFAVTLIARSVSHSMEDALDGVRGALLGVTLGLMVVGGVIKRRR
jgi:hypothetical protein